jgi:hypothetical protein
LLARRNGRHRQGFRHYRRAIVHPRTEAGVGSQYEKPEHMGAAGHASRRIEFA